jgi:hypothetical protein
VKIPTGGNGRKPESASRKADPVRIRDRQYSLDERRTMRCTNRRARYRNAVVAASMNVADLKSKQSPEDISFGLFLFR